MQREDRAIHGQRRVGTADPLPARARNGDQRHRGNRGSSEHDRRGRQRDPFAEQRGESEERNGHVQREEGRADRQWNRKMLKACVRMQCTTRRNKKIRPGDIMPMPAAAADVLAAIRKSPGTRVKVAVSDIDGILRGKYCTRTSSSRRSKAASASATSSTAGIATTSATTTRRSPAGTRAFPTRSRGSISARIARCRGTTTSISSSASSSSAATAATSRSRSTAGRC